MSENLHNIDDLFKDALDGHEEEPSSKVWENLDRKLDKKNVVNINRKYRRVKWVAAASILVACALGMYSLYTRKVNRELVHENKKRLNASGIDKLSKPKTTDYNNSVTKNNDKINPNENKNNTARNTIDNDHNNSTSTNKISGSTNADKSIGLINSKHNKTYEVNKKVVWGNAFDGKQKQTMAVRSSNNYALIKNEKSSGNNLADKSTANTSVVLDKAKPTRGLQANISTETSSTAADNSIASSSVTPSSDTTVSIPNYIQDYSSAVATKSSIHPNATLSNKNSSGKDEQPFAKNVNRSGKGIGKKLSSKTSSSSFTASVFFSPDFIANSIESDHHSFREDDRDEIKHGEKTAFSYTFGALLAYDFYKNWSIQSGFTFSTTVKDIRQKNIFARPDEHGEVRYKFNCSSGYSYITLKSSSAPPAPGDSLKALNSKNTLQYVGIPLSLKYHINAGLFSFTPGLGFITNISTKTKIETEINNGGNKEKNVLTNIEGLKPLYFSGSISIGAAFQLSKALSLSITPTARFALTSINKDSPVKTYQNVFGLAAGINIKL